MTSSIKLLFNIKLADITPISKKKDTQAKKDYRPVHVLPVLKVFIERLMQKQINSFITDHMSGFLRDYRQGFSTRLALVKLIESWRQRLDSRCHSGAVLMNLLKAFDTINHEILIAKPHTSGFNKQFLELNLDYFSNRWKRTKIRDNSSSCAELLQGVPQGLVLGPLSFNIYRKDWSCVKEFY